MRTTILMAGLLAGLAGAAVMAQTAATPDAGATEPAPPEAAGRQGAVPEAGPVGPDFPPHFGGRRRGPGPGILDIALADADGDGLVTPEEVEARQAARLAAADADGDGGLSAEEWVAMEDAMRAEARAAAAVQRIAEIDDSGDGLAQATEIEARTPRIAPVFDRLDADGDGALSQDELAAGPGPGRGPDDGWGPRGRDGGPGRRG